MAPKTPKKTLDLHGHATELLREAASSGAWLALMNNCWVTFQVELLKHRSAIRQRIEKSGNITAFDYWGKSGNQISLLQMAQHYRYTNSNFNVTKAAELINTTRETLGLPHTMVNKNIVQIVIRRIQKHLEKSHWTN